MLACVGPFCPIPGAAVTDLGTATGTLFFDTRGRLTDAVARRHQSAWATGIADALLS
jgi:hypothetical protein